MDWLGYNIEINSCTVVILLILKFAFKKATANLSTDKLLFEYMLNMNLVFSICDVLSVIFLGTSSFVGEIILVLSNMGNIETMTIISYIWILYVFSRLGLNYNKQQKAIFAIPLVIATVELLLNPFTEFVFSIDENNIYSREIGIWLHWGVSWGYIVYGTVITFKALKAATNKIKRRTIAPLLYFILCPTVASIFQVMFYGLSITQMGLAIGIILIFTITVGEEVSTDTLTDLNNRAGMENYILRRMEGQRFQDVTVFIMDLNNFKFINDKHGHVVGDKALKDAAEVLKKSCGSVTKRVFLCRFGGDEFVIIGDGLSKAEKATLTKAIRDESENMNNRNKHVFRIEFSIGMVDGSCQTYEEFEVLLSCADELMYEDKKRLKAAIR